VPRRRFGHLTAPDTAARQVPPDPIRGAHQQQCRTGIDSHHSALGPRSRSSVDAPKKLSWLASNAPPDIPEKKACRIGALCSFKVGDGDAMHGDEAVCGKLFSYVNLEKRVRRDRPLRVIRVFAIAALKSLAGEGTAVPISPRSWASGRRPRIDPPNDHRHPPDIKNWHATMKISATLISVVAMGVVGCSTLPTAGPTASQILDQGTVGGGGHFDIVDVDSRVVAILRAEPAPSLRAQFAQHDKPPPPNIGVGDAVSITIYESGTGGLFGGTISGAAPGTAGVTTQNVTLPEQVVALDGAISVPYAGRVPAAGRTPLQVQQTIDKALAERAIEPQTIVTVTKSVSNAVTVSGEGVTTGSRILLSIRGERLLDVIAAAGGLRSPLYETLVQLSRGGVTAIIPMSTLVSHPEENIYAWPGDVVTLLREPQTFSVFGATQNNSQLPFGADRINLAQAIAKAGGLQDARADPAGVFLFRFEPPPVASAVEAPASATAPDGTAAILYHLDLRQADGYFLAERFPVKKDDLIYVANASSTDLGKLFALISSISGTAISAASLVIGSTTTTTAIGSSVITTTAAPAVAPAVAP
jgi:polysaccharide export outer membrane protein